MPKLILFLFLILNLSCNNNETNTSKNVLNSYFLNLFQNTNYFECNKNLIQKFAKFTDPQGDVKTGAFKIPANNLTFQDILGGEISISESLLTMKIELVSIPNLININSISSNSLIPEIFFRYKLQTNDNIIYIGIENFSNGIITQRSLDNFPVYVNTNNKVETGCGFSIIESNHLIFKCDKSFNKSLPNIDENTYFNVETLHRIKEDSYQDCF
ncbi:hypothetical protein ACO2KH_01930 [Leptospira terpstrae]|uniref:hypothetical protein n=1 Tax=Leptospira terpstrae TaxID=293075 RepID=UPI003D040050